MRIFNIFRIIALTSVLGLTLSAQENNKVPEDMKISTMDRISEMLINEYVFPNIAQKCEQHLTKLKKSSKSEETTSDKEFADMLSHELQSVAHDKHLRVRVRPKERVALETQNPALAYYERMKRMKENNFGFETVSILENNIGYIDLRSFAPPNQAGQKAEAAIKLLEDCDALIFDLRKNGGGSPEMVQLICSYFFDKKTHLNSLYWRKGDVTKEYWTLDSVAGKKLTEVPLFIITSNYTFSGAEEFSYNMLTQNRATLIGEVTGGGANPGGSRIINDRFEIFIPTGRAINPVTGTNWEGVGVQPNILADKDSAYDITISKAKEAAENFRSIKKLNAEKIVTGIENAIEANRKLNSPDAEKNVLSLLKNGIREGLYNEDLINMMGYNYLGAGDNITAILIFKCNSELFPESSNVYDSLAEGYMNSGQNNDAIKYYKKSLELNPENQNAIDMIKKLSSEM